MRTFKELFAFTGFGIAAIALIIFCSTVGFAIIGWAIAVVIGLFSTVDISGYFTYTAIGMVATLVVALLRR